MTGQSYIGRRQLRLENIYGLGLCRRRNQDAADWVVERSAL